MAHVMIMVSVDVRDGEVTSETGEEVQGILESAIQQNWHLLQEHGAQSFTLTFEDIV